MRLLSYRTERYQYDAGKKKWIKKILFPLFSLFLLYRTIELMKQVMASTPNTYTGSKNLIIAVLLVLFVTGIFAFPGFAYPTNRIMPANYYKIKKSKKLDQLYRLLGVKYFRVFLLVFFWGWKKTNKNISMAPEPVCKTLVINQNNLSLYIYVPLFQLYGKHHFTGLHSPAAVCPAHFLEYCDQSLSRNFTATAPNKN
jgi:hypothetical protein